MIETAIIGGTGFDRLNGFQAARREVARTPYGDPSGLLMFGKIFNLEAVFLPRHGIGHTIPPHMVNYRANIWALKDIGVKQIIAFAAVGGIDAKLVPGTIVIPDQIIDYTWGREHTFFDGKTGAVNHIEFSRPYSSAVRNRILIASRKGSIEVVDGSTYAVTQGPRLETAAEIDRLEQDGAHIVGMTGMPEAALARELEIDYAAIAIIVNPAAGRGEEDISMEMIKRNLVAGSAKAMEILKNL